MLLRSRNSVAMRRVEKQSRFVADSFAGRERIADRGRRWNLGAHVLKSETRKYIGAMAGCAQEGESAVK